MTISNGYATLAEMRARVDLGSTDTAAYDTQIELAVEGVSRAIDAYCNTRFYTTANDEARYFTPNSPRSCEIDYALSITSVYTDEDVDGVFEVEWTISDYIVWPYNDIPRSYIETTLYGNRFFSPGLPRSVKAIGKYGYSQSAPADIRQACLIWASRLFKRRDSPLGIAGTSQFGQVKLMHPDDPDIIRLLAPYRRIL